MKKLLFILSFLVASTSYAQEVIGDSLRIADTKAGKVASILKRMVMVLRRFALQVGLTLKTCKH